MATNSNMGVKLPKLEVRHFNGKVQEWQEFWDCHESSIHLNQNLSSINKFSYLRGLLGGAPTTTIAGLALTTANYGVAIDLLRGRFGKRIAIKRTHDNELLNIAPVFNARDTAGLHRLTDKIKIHHRMKLQKTRGKNYTEWKMEDLLKELLRKLELRDEHCRMSKSEGGQYTRIDKDKKRKEVERNTANALLAKINYFFAYCKGGHAHQDCTTLKLVEKRRQLRKYSRCFICVRQGHIFHD